MRILLAAVCIAALATSAGAVTSIGRDHGASLRPITGLSSGARLLGFDTDPPSANAASQVWYQSAIHGFDAAAPSAQFALPRSVFDSLGAALDRVSVRNLPESMVWGLLVIGFGISGFAIRGRRSAGVSA